MFVETLFSQKILHPAYLYDYADDTAVETVMTRDTVPDGFSNYITIYNVYPSGKIQNSKAFIRITISNNYASHKITLDVQLNPESFKPTSIRTRTINYNKMYGTLVIVNGSDTVHYNGIDSMQNENMVLYFAGFNKKRYVFCTQIGQLYTSYEKLIKLDPVPVYLMHANDEAYLRFLDEGTPKRQRSKYERELEQARLDSVRQDSLLKLEMRKQFVLMRDTLFVEASTDTIEDYSDLLKQSIMNASLRFQCTKMKYKGILMVRVDTLGAILEVRSMYIDTSSNNYSAFEDMLLENIRNDTLYPVSIIFQGQYFPMFTYFELPVLVFNDTVDHKVKKESDALYFLDEELQYRDAILKQKLMSSLTENGKYVFKLCYNETQGEKSYLVINLRKGSKQYAKIEFNDQ